MFRGFRISSSTSIEFQLGLGYFDKYCNTTSNITIILWFSLYFSGKCAYILISLQDFKGINIISEAFKHEFNPHTSYKDNHEKWRILFITAYGYSTIELFHNVLRFLFTDSIYRLWFLTDRSGLQRIYGTQETDYIMLQGNSRQLHTISWLYQTWKQEKSQER